MKINNLMLRFEENKKRIKELEQENVMLSSQIISKMEKQNKKNFSLKQDDSILKLLVIERQDLKFDLDLLKSKLSRELYDEITEKQLIVDNAELREILKNNPELKSKLKPALTITRNLNENKMKKMLDNGKLNKESLEGTYNIKSSKYIKLERRKEEEDELE